jgi:hypothetical protein
MPRYSLRICLVICATVSCVTPKARCDVNYEDAPISYSSAVADNPVSRLQHRVQAGETTIEFEPQHGYLKSLLKHLEISPTSQVLSFAKVSLQKDRISPETPRAIYFNDQVHVGYVRGGPIEIAVADPSLGGVFYTVDQNADGPMAFHRRTNSCLTCHGAARTRNVPGFVVRSVFPDRGGQPVIAAGSFVTTHRSPIRERWGGWYVTGTHGHMTHLGNFTLEERKKPLAILNHEGQNVTDLTTRFDTTLYLTPHSDLVALMVLEHQTDALNTMIRAGFEVRVKMHGVQVAESSGSSELELLRQEFAAAVAKAADNVTSVLLFDDETELSSSFAGTSGFTQWFANVGRTGEVGRTLRDFDLETRLFRYPVSYLIHSPTFAGLPGPLRQEVARRIRRELGNESRHPVLSQLSEAERSELATLVEHALSD